MNPAHLLAHFERLADAADAIPRLRRFILDLAVRGKLVPQDPNDEPASELLKRIAAEKAQLPGRPSIRKLKAVEGVDADDEDYPLPQGWVWTQLGPVITLLSGQHLQPQEYTADPQAGLPYVTGPADFGPSGLMVSRYALVRKAAAVQGQLLLTVKGSGVGKTTICNLGEVAISRQLMALTAIGWDQEFLSLVTYQLAEALKQSARSLIPGISREDVQSFLFGLPPLAEQHRIVAKVDELMALCDGLEAARNERESRRDRLVSASLHRLSQPADEDGDKAFRADARFYLSHLPRLTTRPDHIKQLRQTILNLAVRGRLVPQDPAERAPRLPDQAARHESDAKLTFDIPGNWCWARVSEVASARLGKMLDKAKNRGVQYPYLRNTNVHWFEIRTDDLKQVPLADHEVEEYLLQRGDVVICEGGHGIGRSAVWHGEQEPMAFQKALHRVRPGAHLHSDFLAFCCFIYFHEGVMQSYFTGVGIPHFTGRALAQLIFPLPPLAEQHRIVAKVDELMALCDRLEASLAETEDDSHRLLEAVLHEALQPAEGALEAAD